LLRRFWLDVMPDPSALFEAVGNETCGPNAHTRPPCAAGVKEKLCVISPQTRYGSAFP
jgi:hypothetical protein